MSVLVVLTLSAQQWERVTSVEKRKREVTSLDNVTYHRLLSDVMEPPAAAALSLITLQPSRQDGEASCRKLVPCSCSKLPLFADDRRNSVSHSVSTSIQRSGHQAEQLQPVSACLNHGY